MRFLGVVNMFIKAALTNFKKRDMRQVAAGWFFCDDIRYYATIIVKVMFTNHEKYPPFDGFSEEVLGDVAVSFRVPYGQYRL